MDEGEAKPGTPAAPAGAPTTTPESSAIVKSTTVTVAPPKPPAPPAALADFDPEVIAIAKVIAALSSLDEPTAGRVLRYINERFGGPSASDTRTSRASTRKEREEAGTDNGEDAKPKTFKDFASLYDAVSPDTDPERALTAGYWFQVCQNQADWKAQQLNSELKQLGHGISHIATVLDRLMARKPALVRQLSKSGKAKQARKKYRLTDAGLKAVQEMLGGQHLSEDDT